MKNQKGQDDKLYDVTVIERRREKHVYGGIPAQSKEEAEDVVRRGLYSGKTIVILRRKIESVEAKLEDGEVRKGGSDARETTNTPPSRKQS